MSAHLFVYGTLMFPEVVEAILGRRPGMKQALLHGFARLTVRNRNYPGLLKVSGERIEGKLLMELSPAELTALDLYEGEGYRRETVEIVPEGEEPCTAWVYQMADQADLSEEPWEPSRFRVQRSF